MSLLIFSIAVSFVNAFLPSISSHIAFYFSKRRERDKYKKEIYDLRTELKSIHMQDEFPRYARQQRKLTKLVEERRTEERAYHSKQMQISLTVSYVLQGLMTVVSLVMFWLYRFVPVVRFPDDWTYPLDNVLSWPTHSSGAISFPVWFLITNSVAKFLAAS